MPRFPLLECFFSNVARFEKWTGLALGRNGLHGSTAKYQRGQENLTIIFNSLLAYLGTKEKRNHSYYDQGKKERKKKPRN